MRKARTVIAPADKSQKSPDGKSQLNQKRSAAVNASGKDVDDEKAKLKKAIKRDMFRYKSRNSVKFDDNKSDCKDDPADSDDQDQEYKTGET